MLVSSAAIVSVASCTSTSWPHDQFSAPFHEAWFCQARSVCWAFRLSWPRSRQTSTRIARSICQRTPVANCTRTQRLADNVPVLAASRSQEQFGSYVPSIRAGDCCTEHQDCMREAWKRVSLLHVGSSGEPECNYGD